jgi:hypothetical protein
MDALETGIDLKATISGRTQYCPPLAFRGSLFRCIIAFSGTCAGVGLDFAMPAFRELSPWI